MDRKQFLRSCAGGLCACAMAPAAVAAETPAPAEDWRVSFVKKRYAKLLDVLSGKMTDDELAAALQTLGSYCASTFDDKFAKYRGDPNAFAAHIKTLGAGDLFSYDAKRNMVIATSEERTDCICPLIGKAYKTPGVVCNCSIGWHQYAWPALLGKKVQVALKESALRGGKRCTLEIRVLPEPA